MSFGNIGHLFRVGGGNQDARGTFVKCQYLGSKVAIEIDLRADFAGSETALGEGHGKAAIAQVVRRFGKARGHDFADGLLHALFAVEIEAIIAVD